MEKDSRNEKRAAEKAELKKYTKEIRTKLDTEKKDLMDLYFSQTQGAADLKGPNKRRSSIDQRYLST